MQPARPRGTPSPATTRFVEAFWRHWDSAIDQLKSFGLLPPRACQCRPQWPALETEQNGVRTPVEPSEYPIGWSATTGVKARCARCGASYPGNYRAADAVPVPFPQPRRPGELKCSCRPQWPQLVAKLDGDWVVGRSGSDGRRVVNGAEVGAFCRDCGARHIGPMVVLPE